MSAVDKVSEELRKKLNLNHLSEEECEAVLKVIQRDFDLRQHEKDRLNKIEEEVQTEESKAGILAKQKNFNDNCCMRCFSKFFFLINPKVVCTNCHFNVCKSCSEYDKETKEITCHVCLKQKELSKASGEWFYNNVKKKFKRFGSAKVVRSLYKRKTDSEESDYAMSDSALYGRDETTGRKRQPMLTGMFEMDLDDTSSVRPLERAKRLENGNVVAAEEDIIAQKTPDRQYTTPYTCPVGTGGKTFDDACETELNNFRTQLEVIVQDINRVLENNVPRDDNDNSSGVNAREEYEKLVDNHKLHLSSSLSNLSQSLHIAIDNQDVSESNKSPTAKHQLVKQKVVKQCEDFIGSTLHLKDEDITSEYGSESGTEGQPPKPYEDLLSETIVKKLIDDHQKQREKDQKEEDDLLRSLKKLENKATASGLNAELSGSETDTSFTAKARDEVPMSEGSDTENHILQTRREPIGQCLVPEDQSNNLLQNSSQLHVVKQKYISNDDLDDLVRSNTFGDDDNSKEDDEWLKVETTKSPINSQNSTSLLDSDVFTQAIEKGHSNAKHSTPLKSQDSEANVEHGEMLLPTQVEKDLKILKDSMDLSLPVTEKHLNEEELLATDNDDTLLAARKSSSGSVQEDIIEPVDSFRDHEEPNQPDDNNIHAFDFVQKHEITLPSFEITEDTPSEVDLDDISHVSSDSEEYPPNEPVVTLDGNITFGSNWSLSSSNKLKDRSFISAYDNFGNKKIGKEGGSPTMMLVPKADDELSVAKIGDTKNNKRKKASNKKQTNSTSQPIREDWLKLFPVFGDIDLRTMERVNVVNRVRNADDLSDLSENEAKSDIELEDSSSEDEENVNSYNLFHKHDEEGYFDDEGHFIIGRNPQTVKKRKKRSSRSDITDSGVQTEDLDDLKSVSEQEDNHGSSVSGSEYSSPGKKLRSQEILLPTEEIDPTIIEQKVKEKSFDIDERPPSPEVEDVDPKFVKKPEKMLSVLEGEPVKFEVQVDGTKPLDVFWYNDMADIVDLADDDRCDVIQKQGGVYSCEMFNTARSDQGQYLCIAINELGQCSRAFKLKVLENNTNKSAPEFIKPLQDVESTEGCGVKLRCKLKGYPQPRVTWFKDGKRIKNNQQYRIEKVGNRDYVLSIDYLTLDDDAEFSVVAKNIEGEAKTVAQLIVEPKEPDEPEKVDTPRKQNSSLSQSAEFKHLYPDTDDLVKLAEQVQSTRTDVTNSAEDMLNSADRLSRLEKVLNIMENSLDSVESDPMIQGEDANNNDPFNSSYRNTLWREHQEMHDSASNIRITTARALEFLTSMDNDLFSNKDQPLDPEEEVEVNFSYEDYDILYKERKISTDHIRKGKLKRKDLPKLHDFLREYKSTHVSAPESTGNKNGKRPSVEVIDGQPTTIDCGLKRVDSKRYKKDYIIVRNSPKAQRRKKWVVRSPSSEGAEVVKSTPAGAREDPNQEIEEQKIEGREEPNQDNNEQVYLATGQVFQLEDQIKQYEQQVGELDDSTSPGDMLDIERSVAKISAKVAQSDKEVAVIEDKVWHYEQESPRSPMSPVTKTFNYANQESQSPRQHSHDNQQQSLDSPRDPEFMQIRLKRTPNKQVEQEIQEAAEQTSLNYSNQSASPVDNVNQSEYTTQNKDSDLINFENNNNNIEMNENDDTDINTTTTTIIRTDNSTSNQTDRFMGQRRNTIEEDLMNSSTEVHEEDLEHLPSVKNLLTKFKHDFPVEEDETCNLKRVYSLTGRSIPQSIRERLNKQKPVVTNSNLRVNELQAHSSRPHVGTIFEDHGMDTSRPDSGLGGSSGSGGFSPRSSIVSPDASEVSSPRSLFNQSGSSINSLSSGSMNTSSGSKGLNDSSVSRSGSESVSSKQKRSGSESVSSKQKQNTNIEHKDQISNQPVKTTVTKTTIEVEPMKSSITKSTPSKPVEQPMKSSVTKSSTSKPIESTKTNVPKQTQPVKSSVTVTRSASNPTTDSSVKAKLGPPPKRGKNSNIMARAAFWDNRIIQGEASDDHLVDKFPDMPEDAFKSEQKKSTL